MIKNFALFFTWLFHPLLMTTAGMLFILFSGTYLSYIPFEAKKMIIMLVAMGTFLLPLVMVPLFKMKGIITDIHIGKQNERIMPMGITMAFFILTYILFIRIPIFRFVHAYILGSAVSVITGFLLNFRWKVSAHTIGMGGLTALVVGFSHHVKTAFPLVFTGIILLSGIVASSRLYLKAHSQGEIYLGWITGFLVMLSCLLFY